MKYLLFALVLASWLVSTVASAVSISGIVLYSAYDDGAPNGANSYADGSHEGKIQAQLWTTVPAAEWYGLGVWNGLPPQSLAAPPLNNPNFTVDIPLAEGENDFTLLGLPGANTRTDDYSQYTINLYFDGALDHPGISVIFPRENVPHGSPISPSRSDKIYSLDLNQVQASPQATYDDGIVTVSVLAASFLPPETFGADVNLVSAQQLAPNPAGEGDFIGVLRLQVDASPNAGQPMINNGATFGGIPQGIADGGTVHGRDIPIGGAAPRVAAEPGQGGTASEAQGLSGTHGGVAEESSTPGGTVTPAETPSPRVTTGTVLPTTAAAGTSTPAAATTTTPAATGTGSTPTPRVSTTVAVATPTAVRGASK